MAKVTEIKRRKKSSLARIIEKVVPQEKVNSNEEEAELTKELHCPKDEKSSQDLLEYCGRKIAEKYEVWERNNK